MEYILEDIETSVGRMYALRRWEGILSKKAGMTVESILAVTVMYGGVETNNLKRPGRLLKRGRSTQ